jgi:hypothetical protein
VSIVAQGLWGGGDARLFGERAQMWRGRAAATNLEGLSGSGQGEGPSNDGDPGGTEPVER